jgi:hypothetical protein
VAERLVADWIQGFLAYCDFNKEPPPLFKIWTAVSTIAAVLQRKVYLPWERNIYPNMYIVLIGPPGCRKGTAMYPAEQILNEFGMIKLASEALTREQLIRELKTSGTMHVDPTTQDTFFHASLTIHSAELAVFLGYRNSVLMSDLCDWYDCRDRWRYSTKTQGEDDVIGVYVNLLGATTPELLQGTMSVDAIGSGLPSRIVFVYENNRGRRCPDAFITDKERKIRDMLVRDLEQIFQLCGTFKVSPEYISAYTEYYLKEGSDPPSVQDDRFSGYCERRATHLRKLSMILNAARTNSMTLELQDFRAAHELLIRTEKKMPLTFAGTGQNSQANILNKAVMFIGGAGEMTQQELMRLMYRDVDFRTFEALIVHLRNLGIIRVSTDAKGVTLLKYIPPKQDKDRGMFDLQLEKES